jgi:hypothetical protein
VTVRSADGEKTERINMREAAPLDSGFVSLGRFTFRAAEAGAVTVGTDGAGGNAHADAIQVLPVK